MKSRNESFIKSRIRSLLFCLNGLKHLILTEKNVQIQMVCAALISLFGFLVGLSTQEWILQFIVIGMVLTAESINTAIEKLADIVQPKQDRRIGLVKDIAAAAVGISAIVSLIVAGLIYIPKIQSFF